MRNPYWETILSINHDFSFLGSNKIISNLVCTYIHKNTQKNTSIFLFQDFLKHYATFFPKSNSLIWSLNAFLRTGSKPLSFQRDLSYKRRSCIREIAKFETLWLKTIPAFDFCFSNFFLLNMKSYFYQQLSPFIIYYVESSDIQIKAKYSIKVKSIWFLYFMMKSKAADSDIFGDLDPDFFTGFNLKL